MNSMNSKPLVGPEIANLSQEPTLTKVKLKTFQLATHLVFAFQREDISDLSERKPKGNDLCFRDIIG